MARQLLWSDRPLVHGPTGRLASSHDLAVEQRAMGVRGPDTALERELAVVLEIGEHHALNLLEILSPRLRMRKKMNFRKHELLFWIDLDENRWILGLLTTRNPITPA